MQRESLAMSGLKAVGGALVATSALRWLAMSVLTIPPEFQPLATPMPVLLFTAVPAVAAVGVYAALRRVVPRPAMVFRWIGGVVLVLSIMPDLWLLTDAATEAFPGATPTAVLVLIVLHLAAAVPIIWFLTRGGDPERELVGG